jgi:membrane dipeptidase
MLVVDSHEDIAWSALTWGRDMRRSALETRQLEANTDIPQDAGLCMLGLPEWLAGRVAIVFGTVFALPRGHGSPDVESYATAEQAHALGQGQLDYYHRLAEQSAQVRLVGSRAELEETLRSWEGDEPQVGILPIMEGADPILEPAQVDTWFQRGLRAIGPAWRSGSRYAGGDGQPGRLTEAGRELLDVMAEIGLMLDVSHLSDESVREALDRFEGQVMASHSNPRARVEGERQLPDEIIRRLAERDGVVGVVPFNAFLRPDWTKGDAKDAVSTADVAAAIDHVCQVVGDAEHVGLGSDFDGGFGAESAPAGMDTVADLQRVAEALEQLGYAEGQIEGILGSNWLTLLHRSLPD